MKMGDYSGPDRSVDTNCLYPVRVTSVKEVDDEPAYGFGFIPGMGVQVHVDFRSGHWFASDGDEVEFAGQRRAVKSAALQCVPVPKEGDLVFAKLEHSKERPGKFTADKWGREMDYQRVLESIQSQPLLRVRYDVRVLLAGELVIFSSQQGFSGRKTRFLKKHVKPLAAPKGEGFEVAVSYLESLDNGKSWVAETPEQIWGLAKSAAKPAAPASSNGSAKSVEPVMAAAT